MSRHLRRGWMKLRLRKRAQEQFQVGDRVTVNHPEIGVPVGGVITAIVPTSSYLVAGEVLKAFVRFDGITDVALVPVDMMERE